MDQRFVLVSYVCVSLLLGNNNVAPLSFDRQHLSYDDCLWCMRGDYQNCSVL